MTARTEGRLWKLWKQYRKKDITTSHLLKAVSHIAAPTEIVWSIPTTAFPGIYGFPAKVSHHRPHPPPPFPGPTGSRLRFPTTAPPPPTTAFPGIYGFPAKVSHHRPHPPPPFPGPTGSRLRFPTTAPPPPTTAFPGTYGFPAKVSHHCPHPPRPLPR